MLPLFVFEKMFKLSKIKNKPKADYHLENGQCYQTFFGVNNTNIA
jgi:hypothetical protein